LSQSIAFIEFMIGSLAWGPSHEKTQVYKAGDVVVLPEDVVKRLTAYRPYEVEILPED